MAVVRTDQPVRSSIQRETARAANTWAAAPGAPVRYELQLTAGWGSQVLDAGTALSYTLDDGSGLLDLLLDLVGSLAS